MNEDFITPLEGRSRLWHVFDSLRQHLLDILPVRPEEVTPTQRFDRLIPPVQRRVVWQELRQAGFHLPRLRLPTPLLLGVALVVLAPVGLLIVLLSWWHVFTLAELSMFAHRLTRPWAVEPPRDCETLQEAVLQLTPFVRKDYAAGLWPKEAIAIKVRSMVAKATGYPLASVKADTRLNDICC